MGSQRIINEEDKLSRLQRMEAGENISELAREAGVSRQRLYDWRDRLRLAGSLKRAVVDVPGRRRLPRRSHCSNRVRWRRRLRRRRSPRRDGVSPNWNRKSASSSWISIFFQEALRHIRDDHRQNTAPGGTGSSRSSKK
ncbi:helix-turn-helix domain-containing protein [Mesorhizobium sp. M0012]|uniref:helix-turn-helix domain-containing protein n=1 Tax=Mesorhizobium sp. M0012 TaxID=2956840 RepID=UPI00333709B3